MSVRDWHPGKIGLMWAGYLLLFWLVWETECFGACAQRMSVGGVRFTHGVNDVGVVLTWLVLAIPGVVIT